MTLEQKKANIQELIDKCRFGVDYYPEHWPETRWETDADMMKELGFQVVRMAEFSWQKMEPAEGCFDFDWLDQTIALLGKRGIVTILGTPTAAPPAWIIEENPDILPVDFQGQKKSFGARHHDCMSNSSYRTHIRRFVTAMAEHFRDNPYVIGWQIDNELGNSHADLCTCDSCKASFQNWLKKKYQKIEAVNNAWGTCFWSQGYDKFEQIPAPRQTPTGTFNPSHMLDWKRFCSELLIDFQREQVRILREICPHQQITHNLMGLYDKSDYFKFAEDLDFASNDQYPTGYYFNSPGQSPAEIGACLDLIRSVKKKNIWMMELLSGATGGNVIGHTPRPGQIRLWTSDCVAHGSDTIIYFRWRTSLYGVEQFWHGILPHNGVPDRRYSEIAETVKVLTPVLDDIHGIYEQPETAILFSYDQDWALQIQPNHPQLTYVGEILRYYEAFHSLNVPMRFVSEEDALDGCRLVIAPLLYLEKEYVVKKLTAFAKGGGTVILTMRTGVKDPDNNCLADRPLPGGYIEAAGIAVEEYDCLLWENAGVRFGKTEGTGFFWADKVNCISAVPIAEFTSGLYSSSPAITRNQYGEGTVYYVAAAPDAQLLRCLCMDSLQRSRIDYPGEAADGIELAMRRGRSNDYLFVMNHTGKHREVTIGTQTISLAPYGVEILKNKKVNPECK